MLLHRVLLCFCIIQTAMSLAEKRHSIVCTEYSDGRYSVAKRAYAWWAERLNDKSAFLRWPLVLYEETSV